MGAPRSWRLLGGLIVVVLLAAIGTALVDPFDDDADDVAVSAPTTASSTSTSTSSTSSTSTTEATTSTSGRSPASTAAPATPPPTTAAVPTTTLGGPTPTATGEELSRGAADDRPPAGRATDEALATTGDGSAAGTALGLLVIVLGLIATETARRLRA